MLEFNEDLIDRKPLMDQINSLERNEKLDRFQVAKFLVENAPSCNPLYRHSKWIVKGEFCSGDGLHIEYECLGCQHSITRSAGYLPPYCEQCGAFMTGGIQMPMRVFENDDCICTEDGDEHDCGSPWSDEQTFIDEFDLGDFS